VKLVVRHRLLPRVQKSPILRAATTVCTKLQEAGHEGCFNGGAVRDMLLHPQAAPTDVDICTDASPERVAEIFPGTGFVGKAFGVSLVKLGGFSFECATYRCEGAYSDRRHPDSVRPGTQEEDSRRRDFTVNALYFDPVAETLTDYHGGREHLREGVLACVGDAHARLFEDALRIVRLFRFAVATGFSVEPRTLAAARAEDVKAGVRLLSKERFLAEFSKVKAGLGADFFSRLLDSLEPAVFDAGLVSLQDAVSAPIEAAAWKNPPLSTLHKEYPATVFGLFLCAHGLTEQTVFGALEKWPLQSNDRELLRVLLHLRARAPIDAQTYAAKVEAHKKGGAFGVAFDAFVTMRALRKVRFLPPETLAALLGSKPLVTGEVAFPSRAALAALHVSSELPPPVLGVLHGLQDAFLLRANTFVEVQSEPISLAIFAADAPDWQATWLAAASLCLPVSRSSLAGLQVVSQTQR